MTSPFRHACFALVFVATAAPANAQTWVYEPDTRPRYYEPDPGARYYYEPRARYWGDRYDRYYDVDARARVYEPDTRVVVGSGTALALTPTQRTTIYRTIIPQGRGKGPIVRERIVTETIAPAPVVRERVVTEPTTVDYTVGSRVTDAYALAPMPAPLVRTVPAVRSYRYMVVNNRLLLVDPATGIVMADLTE
jgi:hypothetical protein